MPDKVELRIHTAARSTFRDDERHRTRAHAYISDQTSWRCVGEEVLPIHQQHGSEHPAVSSSSLLCADTTFLDDTQAAYTALESQIQTSSLLPSDDGSTVLHNGTSPVDDRVDGVKSSRLLVSHEEVDTSRCDHPGSAQESPSKHASHHGGNDAGETKTPVRESPSEHLSQSSHLKTPVFTRSGKRPFSEADGDGGGLPTPERIAPALQINVDSRHGRASPPFHGAIGPPTSAIADYQERTPQPQHIAAYMPLVENSRLGVAYIGDKVDRGGRNADESQQTTSELPTSYSLSDIATDSSRARRQMSLRSVSDPGPMGKSSQSPSIRRSLRSHSEGSVVSRSDEHSSAAHANASTNVDCTSHARPAVSPVSPTDALRTAPVAATTAPLLCHSEHHDGPAPSATSLLVPTIIRPPEPAVSALSLNTHITNILRLLKERTAFTGVYRPDFVSREIEMSERGYWYLDASTWSQVARESFHAFLVKTIGAGSAGFGVWCVWTTARDDLVEQRETSPASNTLLLKVFCWGEIVQHIYLLLYVASRSKIRKLRLQWIDANGNVVVQMPSKVP